MKTALLLIPIVTDAVNRSEYLQICIDKMQKEDYVPLTPNIYDTVGGINEDEFINNTLPFVQVVFLFIDFGIDKQMFSVIDRCVAQKIEIRYKRNLRIDLNKAFKNPNEILYDVCRRTGFKIEDMQGKCRMRDMVDARYIYFRRAKEKTTATLTAIGKVLNKDHATVIHGIKQAETVPELIKLYEKYYGKTSCKKETMGKPIAEQQPTPDCKPVERPVLPYRSMDKREQAVPDGISFMRSMPARGYYNAIGGYRPHNS